MASKKSPKGSRSMTKAHKEALARGRSEAWVVRGYLDALDAHKPKRGRKRTPESIERRLATIDGQIDDVDRLSALKMAQERLDLRQELASLTAGDELEEWADEFVEVAASYGERHGISYAAWREAGVPAAVLRVAGITRGA